MGSNKRNSSNVVVPSKASWTKLAKKFGALQAEDKVTLIWFMIDAATHLTIELGYLWLALTTTAAKGGDGFLAKLWREYGRADKRWSVRDTGIVSVEIATVFVGVLCLFLVYGVWSNRSWRTPLQIIVCTCELYGGWMTFAPEWFSVPPNPNLSGSDPVLFYIYLWFMNGLWVVVPLVLLWDSWSASARTYAPSRGVFLFTAGLIGTYMILVPAVLVSRGIF